MKGFGAEEYLYCEMIIVRLEWKKNCRQSHPIESLLQKTKQE